MSYSESCLYLGTKVSSQISYLLEVVLSTHPCDWHTALYAFASNGVLCSLQSVSARVCDVTVLLEERLLLSLLQWAGEGLASTDKTASSEGKEAFEMLTRRCGSGWGYLWV